MAKIPTTERKYYNNTPKVNTFETYATAAYNIMQGAQQAYKQIKTDQEKIKIDSFSTDAQVELNDITNQWRLQNQSDPTNPDALRDLDEQYSSVFQKYREQIDPIAKVQWDSVARNMKNKYTISNQDWGFQQNQVNTENRIKLSMKNYYSMSSDYGANGDLEGFIENLNTGYNQMLDNGARVLGTETAALLLNDFEEKSAESFVNGLASSDPSKAMELLKDSRISAMLGADKSTVMTKLMKAQVKNFEFNNKLNEYNVQMDVVSKLNSATTPIEQYHILEEYSDMLPTAFYKRQLRIINHNTGITAEDRDSFTGDINDRILGLQLNESLSPENVVNEANQILDDLTEGYEKGYVSKKTLMATQKKVNDKIITPNIQGTIAEAEEGWFRFMKYDVAHAKDDLQSLGTYYYPAINDVVSYVGSEEFENSKDKRQALKDYVKSVKSEYNAKASKSIVGQLNLSIDIDKGGKITSSIKVGTRIKKNGKTYVYMGGNYKDGKNYKEVK